MTTTELITALRDVAAECEDMERIRLCREAADKLEELYDAAWDVFEMFNSAYSGIILPARMNPRI